MSWDPSTRYISIKSLKKNEKELCEIIKKLNKTLTVKFSMTKEIDKEEILIELEEDGYMKHGGFSNGNNYALYQFIDDLLLVDKDNTIVYESHDTFLDDDRRIYYFENGKKVCTTEKAYKYSMCNSKDEKIKMIKRDFSYFELLSVEEQKDFDYQMASLSVDYGPVAWEYGSDSYDQLYTEEFLDREETVRAIFKYGGRFNLFKNRVKDIYKNNDKLMKECLKYRPDYICCLPFKFRDDKELVLSLIEMDEKGHFSLNYLSKRLRNDKKVVLNFIKHNPSSLEYASNRLKNDYDVCLMAIKMSDCAVLKNVKNKDILNDKNLILPFFKSSDRCVYEEYACIGDDLKNDKDFLVEWLVQRHKMDHSNASAYRKKIKAMDMKTLTLFAIDNEFLFKLDYVGSNLLNNKDFIREVMKRKDDTYLILGDTLKNDAEFLLEVAKAGFHCDIGMDLYRNKEFIIKNIHKFYFELEYFDDDILNDFEVAKALVKENGKYILRLNEVLQQDNKLRRIALSNWNCRWDFNKDEFVNFFDLEKDDFREIIKKNPFILRIFPELLKRYNNKELFLDLFKNGDYSAFEYVKDLFADDKDVALEAVKYRFDNYMYLSDELKDDDEIALAAIKLNESNLFYLSKKHLDNEELIKKAFPKFNKKIFCSFDIGKISPRLQNDKFFLADLFGFDKVLSLEDIYIKYYSNYNHLYSFNLTLPTSLANSIKLIRFLLVKTGSLNHIDDYPECTTVNELYDKLEGTCYGISYFRNLGKEKVEQVKDEVPLFDDSDEDEEAIEKETKKNTFILDDEFKEEYEKLYEASDDYIKVFDNEIYDPLNYDDSDVEEDFLVNKKKKEDELFATFSFMVTIDDDLPF